MKSEKSVKVGRLALRHEGGFWNAYYALPYSMNEAAPLGSIAMAFVADKEDRKQAFMDLMRECVADIIEQETGTRPTWPDGPQAAPEHERSGHS
jgi:hypothetical protein